MAPVLDGQAAAQKLLSLTPYRQAGLCLEAVYYAFGGPAWSSNRPGYYTYADRARQDAKANGRLSLTRDIPAGAVVYLTPGSNGYGHICISLGGDKVVSTDTPSGRSIGVTTISALCNKWGRSFAGWSDTLMGHQITNLGAVGPAATGGDKGGNAFFTKEQYKAVQGGYRAIGYDLGPAGADGIHGPTMDRIIRDFQGKQGLKVDGVHGPVTEAKLILAQPKVPNTPATGQLTTAHFGRVDVVQKALKTKYPAYASHLKVDNVDGPATIAVVKEFQRRMGLKADGVAGPVTRKALGV